MDGDDLAEPEQYRGGILSLVSSASHQFNGAGGRSILSCAVCYFDIHRIAVGRNDHRVSTGRISVDFA